VPGIDEKDIDIRVENNLLTVHGERKIEKEEKERTIAAWSASTAASPALHPAEHRDTENVQASYDKGVLKITLPKKAEAKPKQIKGNVGSGKAIEGKGSESKSPAKAAVSRQRT